MISSYRLGDLILVTLNNNERNSMLNDYPDSIGSNYIKKTNNNPNVINEEKIDIISNLVLDFSNNKFKNLIPDDIENSTVIHLRLGDVIAGKEYHEISKRPLSVDYLKNVCPKNDKIYIIGKSFFAHTSSKNYDECIQKSDEYLNLVINELNAVHIVNNSLNSADNADLDFCCAVKSKNFIQGKGFFSGLIVSVRNKLNKKSIETKIYD